MSTIKSLSVGNGDMFYIDHDRNNFTIIDCCLKDEKQKDKIVDEIRSIAKVTDPNDRKKICFISTHPDKDHIQGIDFLDDSIGIDKFYVVGNQVNKHKNDPSFNRYYCLRDDGNKSCYIDERSSIINEITFLWPKLYNRQFIKALNNEDVNNISPIFTFTQTNGINPQGVKAIWFGDIESDFLDSIENDICWPKVHILFAPHHSRKSGRIKREILEKLSPKIIVVGEGPSEYLDYYKGFDTITQNTAGNITIISRGGYVHLFVENKEYKCSIKDIQKLEEAPSLCSDNYLGYFEW